MICWKCAKNISEVPVKIGFRAVCPHCEADLHVCKNCRYYAIGKPNDCLVPGTEYIRDREAFNFCEEFKVKIPEHPPSSTNQAHRLFGLDGPEKKKDFGSLFKDEDET
ncbi:MAG: hypothetical protein V4487_00750 [Chlamydiota bacterium]